MKRSIEIKVRLNRKEAETLDKRVKKSGLSREGYLSAQLGCEYVSDLYFLDALARLRLAHVVSKLSPDDWPLKEWNDAPEYVANKEATDNCMLAYDTFLSDLQ